MAPLAVRQRIRRRARVLYAQALIAMFFAAAAIASDLTPLQLRDVAYVVGDDLTGAEIAAVIVGATSLACGLAALAVWAHARLTAAGPLVDALADPDVCPYCGGPYGANDDVVTPHECGEEAGI